MKLNLISDAVNSITALNQVAAKIEPAVAAVIKESPNLSLSAAQINRSMELSKDPPATIVKYTNSITKEVELQIPSEVSLRIYKANQAFSQMLESKRDIINIKV